MVLTEKKQDAYQPLGGLVYEPASGTIRHSMDTAIIGADGRLVKVFSNGTWDQEAAVAIVAREAARASTVNRH